MTDKRKHYDRNFKLSAVEVVLKENKTIKALSNELGISDSMLGRWVHEYEELGKDAFPGNGSPAKPKKTTEVSKLKKQIEDLEIENEILKTAWIQGDDAISHGLIS